MTAKELCLYIRSLAEPVITEGDRQEICAYLDRLAAIDSAVTGEVGEIATAHEKSAMRCPTWGPGDVRAYEAAVNADRHRATLLALVHRQAGDLTREREAVALLEGAANGFKGERDAARAEVERQAGELYAALAMEAQAEKDGDEARAEVERLTKQNAILRKQVALKDQDRAQLIAEVERLKQIVADSVCALGNHSVISPECTVEFMSNVPAEVRSAVGTLREANATLAAENARLVNEHAAAMSRADLLQMRLDASQETLTKVVHERNNLRTKEQAQSERADVLAEGVWSYRKSIGLTEGWPAISTPQPHKDWEREHGHMVSI